jgi:hypothetical protein
LSTTTPLVPEAASAVAVGVLLEPQPLALVTLKFIMQPMPSVQIELPVTPTKIQSMLVEVLKNSATGEQLAPAVVRAGPVTGAPMTLLVIGIW